MHQHQAGQTYQRTSSEMGDSAPDMPRTIWQDTSEAELYGNYLDNDAAHHHQQQQQDNMQMRPTFAIGAGSGPAHTHPDITVGLLDEDTDGARSTKTKGGALYSGRKRVWPGALVLLFIIASASATITYFAVRTYNDAQAQQKISEEFISPVISKKAVLKVCRVPNYVTDKSKLYAIGGSEKHEVHFTGINWSGMENKEGVPHGLAGGQSNLEEIAQKLHDMEINAVRLPLNAKMVIDDSEPDTTKFVTRSQAELFGVSTYTDMIKKIVQGLARKQIAVLLDLHKIDPAYNKTTSEELWYTDEVSEDEIIAMYTKLATLLCNEQHYNIIGVDIKNEPVGGCWPAKDSDKYCDPAKNWPRAVERIGNAIHKVCPNWLIVVEGLYATQMVAEFNGKNATYNDWFGASLQNATVNPIELKIANKIVYAPHFYSPSVYPSAYFFASQSSTSDGSVTLEEYPNTVEGNKSLADAVTAVLDGAFGEVLTKGTAPVFYGEFGGIYGAKELLKGKTSTRVIDVLIQYAAEKGMIGGFSWALNPDGNYDFNDVYVGNLKDKKPWEFGLYDNSKWDEYNTDYATGLKALKGNGIIPCFPRAVVSSNTTTTTKPTSTASVAGSGSAGK